MTTFDVKHDYFALDWTGVDRAAILALIFRLNVSDLQIPFLGVGLYNLEARVVDDSSVLVGQRNRTVVEPGHLRIINIINIVSSLIY